MLFNLPMLKVNKFNTILQDLLKLWFFIFANIKFNSRIPRFNAFRLGNEKANIVS